MIQEAFKARFTYLENAGFTVNDGIFSEEDKQESTYFCYIYPPGVDSTDAGSHRQALYLHAREIDIDADSKARELVAYATGYFYGKGIYDPINMMVTA